jgi:putative endonuclease
MEEPKAPHNEPYLPHQTGRDGEQTALAHLEEQGYSILETNWRYGKDEIDIIAIHKDELVIIEVKTRHGEWAFDPESAVNRTKQRFMIRAADHYVRKNEIDLNVRFDIIAIIYFQSTTTIKHITDAFTSAG